jgi:hypothetical protein
MVKKKMTLLACGYKDHRNITCNYIICNYLCSSLDQSANLKCRRDDNSSLESAPGSLGFPSGIVNPVCDYQKNKNYNNNNSSDCHI